MANKGYERRDVNQDTILIVEDLASTRKIYRAILEQAGYHVSEAIDYDQAIALVDSSIDLALVDISLGGKSGIEVLKFFQHRHPDCPVIMVSAFSDKRNAIDSLREGATDYLEKPVEPDELLLVVERWLSYRFLKKENVRLQDYQAMYNAIQQSEVKFRAIIEASPVPLALNNEKGNIVYLNKAFVQAVGYTTDDIPTLADWWSHAFPEPQHRQWVVETWLANMEDAKRTDSAFAPMELNIRCKDGSTRIFMVGAAPLMESFTENHLVVLYDITERKRTEEQLRISNLRFEAVLEAVPDSMFEMDLKGRYLNVWGNRGDLLAASENMLLGNTVYEILPLSAADEVLAAISEADMKNQSFGRQVKLTSTKGDSWFELSVAKQPSTTTHGARFIVVSRDITERKLAEAQIHKLAFYDILTQLPNRRLLNDRLEQAMVASKRSNLYGALIFMDMDNFKPLNDKHGHETGDLLLIEVAHRISSCVREMDTVARFGGDEFVVVLRELDVDKARSAKQASIVAKKIGVTLATPYVFKIRHDGKKETTIEHHCTTSIGVMVFIKHEASREEIVKWADIAMYQAKEAGGNQIRFYEPKT